MAVGARVNSASSSLQRLLSLDKSFDDLEQRIQEAARILRLPNHESSAADLLEPAQFASVHSPHTARHEYVLRWLLEKLNKDPVARKSPLVWSTLLTTLGPLPSPIIAKLLPASNLLPSIVRTLAEIFPGHHLLPADAAPVLDQQENVSQKATKKRKRVVADAEEAQKKQSDRSTVHLSESQSIFLSIAALLRLLLHRAQGPHTSAYAPVHNQIASILRLETPQFATLLKHWLTALLQFCTSGSAPLLPSTHFVSGALRLIWDLSSLQTSSQSGNADSFDALFCQECASPAALLLSRLHDVVPDASGQAADLSSSLQVLERLLAQNLFVPARTAFNATSHGRPASAKPSPRRNQAGLTERLEPFRAQVVHLAAAAAADSASSRDTLRTAERALSNLLDVALRCTPTSTPKQRIAEASWIDSLFTSLCHVLPESTTSNPALARMLNVVLRRKLSLGSTITTKLISDWSGLLSLGQQGDSPTIAQPDFHLVAKILAIDPTIFTDAAAPRTLALFRALTVHGQINEQDAQEKEAKQILLCTSIAVPLMKAFTRIRNLKGFLDEWLSQLQTTSQWESNSWFIWTDPTLQASLRDVLEVSLTAAQITDFIQARREEITLASAVLLNSVLSAVHSDAIVDTLQVVLQSTIADTQDLIGGLVEGDEVFMKTLLELLSRLYLLWFPVWSTSHTQQDVDVHLGAVLSGSVVQRCLAAIAALPKSAAVASERQHSLANAAFGFLVILCDQARQSQTHQNAVKALFTRATFSETSDESAGKLAVRPTSFYTCTASFPSLLQYLPETARAAVFKKALHLASHGSAVSQATVASFVDAVTSSAERAAREELFTTILDRLSTKTTTEAERSAAGKLLLQWSAKGLARQQREKVLDVAVDAILGSADSDQDIHPQLSLMVNLMSLPNATAKIATDPSTAWQLATVISRDAHRDLALLNMFEEICGLLFMHIIDTKEQERSGAFLTNVSENLAHYMVTKEAFRKAAAQTRLLAMFVKLTEARLDATMLSKLPHRSSVAIDSLVKRLYQTLSSSVEKKGTTSDTEASNTAAAVRILHSIPTSFLAAGGSSSNKYAKRTTQLLEQVLRVPAATSSDASAPLSSQVQSFQLLAPSKISEDAAQSCNIAGALLLQDLDAKEHHAVIDTFSKSAVKLPDAEKLSLITQLMTPKSGQSQVDTEKVSIVRCLLMSLESVKTNDDNSSASVTVLTNLLRLLRTCTEFSTHCELVGCVVALLRNKPTLVTQYGVELTVSSLIHLTTPAAAQLSEGKSYAIFEGICEITHSLLQFHRSSLGGRYHLFVPLLERLVACLFTPASRDSAATGRFKHPIWLDSRQHPLTVGHAQRVSRLLEHLCNPQQSDVARRRRHQEAGPDLVDMTRKTRIQVGQHVQHILHYLCTFLLNGRLGEGMRDALTPGLWAVMDVIEIGADESRGIKALSASMNNAERAILRGIFEDWRRFGSWSG